MIITLLLTVVIMPRGGATAYGSSFVIMPRAELSRYTVIVLSVRLSFCLTRLNLVAR